MRKYLGLRQNDVDPSPEARKQLGAAVDFLFRLAEYALITGVFGYLAAITGDWAVITLAVVLGVLLGTYVFSMVAGFQIFLWREAKTIPLKITLLVLDATIFLGIFYTLHHAFFAILETMKEGVGI